MLKIKMQQSNEAQIFPDTGQSLRSRRSMIRQKKRRRRREEENVADIKVGRRRDGIAKLSTNVVASVERRWVRI